MALKRIDAGKRMSAAVIHNGMAYLAGFVAEVAKGKSVVEQTKDILAQIDSVLKTAGSNKANIVKANIWLTDIGTFAEMNAAWDDWVTPGVTPARATVESKLAAPGYDVEIMVEAAIIKKPTKAKAVARPAKKAAKKKAKRK
jgi:enamine deaminase RidA (YjgF/YER057c/UK114 family)